MGKQVKVYLFGAVLAAAGAMAAVHAADEISFSEKLQLDWDEINEWKVVKRSRSDLHAQFTLTPDPNVVNFHKHLTIIQTKVSQYTPFDEFVANLKTQETPFEVVFDKVDFGGSQKKALIILADRRQTQVTAMIKGEESFIVISYTDLTIRPSEELIKTWVDRWERAGVVPNQPAK